MGKTTTELSVSLTAPPAATVIDALRQVLARQSTRVISLLRSLANDVDGCCSRREFRSALRASGCPARSADIDKLFNSWDTDSDGSITLIDMLRTMHRGGTPKLPRTSRTFGFVPITQREICEPIPVPDAVTAAAEVETKNLQVRSLTRAWSPQVLTPCVPPALCSAASGLRGCSLRGAELLPSHRFRRWQSS